LSSRLNRYMTIPADSLPGDHLRAEELQEGREALCRFLETHPALISDTSTLSEQLAHYFAANTADAISLEKGEMDMVRQELCRFIRGEAADPIPLESMTERFFENLSALSRGFFPRMVAVCCMVLIVGNTVAFAAADTVPGDQLYPVKVKVLEPARALVTMTSEGKAKWASNCVRRRLAETERLIAQDRLTSDVWLTLNESIARNTEMAEKHIMKLAENSAAAAADLSADLHLVLDAHGQVFADIGQVPEYEVVAGVASDLANVTAKTALLYAHTEESISADAAFIEQAVTRVLRSASSAAFSLNDGAENAERPLLPRAQERAESAKQFLKNAEERMKAGEFRESLREARMAIQKAEEGNAFKRMNLHLDMPVTVSSEASSSATSVLASSGSALSIPVNVPAVVVPAVQQSSSTASSLVPSSSSSSVTSMASSSSVAVSSSSEITQTSSSLSLPIDLPPVVPDIQLLH
jgi:hypothetical protein